MTQTEGDPLRAVLIAVFYPALAITCVLVGAWAWRSVPSAADVEALHTRVSEARAGVEERRASQERAQVQDDIATRLPSTLEFADFLERIEASAARAGIVGLRVDSAEAIERAPTPELRSYGGRLEFETSWEQVVVFLSEIERGAPAMRVRSLTAESLDKAIRVECVLDAWAYSAAPGGKE